MTGLTLHLGNTATIAGTLDVLPDAAVTVPPWSPDAFCASSAGHAGNYLDWLAKCFAALRLKPNVSIAWLWPGDRVARGEALAVLPDGFTIRHVGAIHKPGMDPRPDGGLTSTWEAVIWATRGKVRYHGPCGGPDCIVIDLPSAKAAAPWHPCPASLEAMERIIGWVCPPGGVVLDPFCGSGTTLLAARNTGRRAIGIEQDSRFAAEAGRRLGIEVQGEETQQPPTGGPGTELHKLLLLIVGEGPTSDCDCRSRIAKMNRWGPDGCRKRLDTITDWLLGEAEERGWKSARWLGSRTAVKLLVRWAIRKADQSA